MERIWDIYTYIPFVVISESLGHVWLFETPPWTVAHQAPLSMGFSRQEYWRGWPLPSLGDLPNPRIEPASLVSPVYAGRFFTTEPPGKPYVLFIYTYTHIFTNTYTHRYIYVKQNHCLTYCTQFDSGGEMYDIPYMQNLTSNDTNELIYKLERDSQT